MMFIYLKRANTLMFRGWNDGYNTVFVKILPCTDELCADCDKGFPYNGAKEHYILDLDDSDFAKRVIYALEPVIPVPKPRKKKG